MFASGGKNITVKRLDVCKSLTEYLKHLVFILRIMEEPSLLKQAKEPSLDILGKCVQNMAGQGTGEEPDYMWGHYCQI